MAYSAKILADSISPAGHRLTTFEVTFPRIVLAEFNTHRMLSRNSASSRAIPFEKRIAAVVADPFFPEEFVKNQKGMQHSEALEGHEADTATYDWHCACESAVSSAKNLAEIGVHKALANRLLEPFSWHTVIVTATDWENFFNLRCHPNAQAEIRKVAGMMRELYRKGEPRPVNYGDWHLPLIQLGEAFDIETTGMTSPMISAARCARVSYLTHDGKRDPQADLDLYEKLTTNGHMSPLEHPARPMTPEELVVFARHKHEWWDGRGFAHGDDLVYYLGNLNGWVQLRKLIPGEDVFVGERA